MDLYISAHPPFILTNLIRSHGWIQLPPFETDDDYSKLSYILKLGTGKVVDLQIQEANGGINIAIDEQLSAAEQEEVEEIAIWMLELNFDLSDFYQIARSEPKLAHAETNARGRILRCATIFEDVIKTILTTNTTWSGTRRMVKALVDQYGEPLPSDSGRRAFPSPQELASTNVETLRMDSKLGYRAPYVQELAQRVTSGELDLEALKADELSTAELRKRLLALKGVGDYAAANLLMILGRYDYIPVDSWALTMVSREWYDGLPISRNEVEATFEKWGEWRGLAYWLWDWSE